WLGRGSWASAWTSCWTRWRTTARPAGARPRAPLAERGDGVETMAFVPTMPPLPSKRKDAVHAAATLPAQRGGASPNDTRYPLPALAAGLLGGGAVLGGLALAGLALPFAGLAGAVAGLLLGS